MDDCQRSACEPDDAGLILISKRNRFDPFAFFVVETSIRVITLHLVRVFMVQQRLTSTCLSLSIYIYISLVLYASAKWASVCRVFLVSIALFCSAECEINARDSLPATSEVSLSLPSVLFNRHHTARVAILTRSLSVLFIMFDGYVMLFVQFAMLNNSLLSSVRLVLLIT